MLWQCAKVPNSEVFTLLMKVGYLWAAGNRDAGVGGMRQWALPHRTRRGAYFQRATPASDAGQAQEELHQWEWNAALSRCGSAVCTRWGCIAVRAQRCSAHLWSPNECTHRFVARLGVLLWVRQGARLVEALSEGESLRERRMHATKSSDHGRPSGSGAADRAQRVHAPVASVVWQRPRAIRGRPTAITRSWAT